MIMDRRVQWLLVLVIVGLLAGALAAGLAVGPTTEPRGVGRPAPEFRALDLATSDTVSLERYRGDVVFLNIWATWCTPCEAEMPSIQRLHEALGEKGLRVVAVSIDQGSPDKVRAWLAARGLTFQVLFDPTGRIERLYGTVGVPESYVIDREGVIVERVIGATDWDHPTRLAMFRRLLGLADADAVHRGD